MGGEEVSFSTITMIKEIQELKRIVEDHFSAINDNTNEIQVLFEYLQEIENKVDRLAHRLDLLQSTAGKKIIAPLSNVEKQIFLVLYTEEMPLSFEELADKARLDLSFVREHLSKLSDKGIPLQRHLCNGQFFFTLNKEFKEKQAKENIVNLSLDSFM